MFSTFNFETANPIEVHNRLRPFMAKTGGSQLAYKSLQQQQPVKPNFYGIKSRSRNGCLHCKKMKKKCDQKKPGCSLCSRKKIECVYRKAAKNDEVKPKAEKLKSPRDSSAQTVIPNTLSQYEAALYASLALTPMPTPLQNITMEFNSDATSSSPTVSEILDLLKEGTPPSMKAETDEAFLGRLVELSDEEEVTPMDDSQVIENQQTRNGFFDDAEFTQILLQIVKGDGQIDLYWVSPNKVAYFSDLRKIYRHSYAIVRSPSCSSIFAKLDDLGLLFFENYRYVVGEHISLSPVKSDNYFKSLFIPLAEQDESILYALTAWGGMSLVGRCSSESRNYMKKGSARIEDKARKINAELAKKDASNRNISNDDVLTVLSFYLICIGAEISTGDVDHWTTVMTSCYNILSKIGLKRFLLDSVNSHAKEALWLISNFFYHDITHFSKQATSFSVKEYEEVLAYGGQLTGVSYVSVVDYGIDPLNGCNTALYLIKGEIVNAHYEFSEASAKFAVLEESMMFQQESNGPQDNSTGLISEITELNNKRQILLDDFAKTCDRIDRKIDEAKPSAQKMGLLDKKSSEIHLTLFELMQLSLKLFVNLWLRRKPPASDEIQTLLISVLDDIRILVGTSVECSLNFPLMIASFCCYKKYDRFLMNEYFRRAINSAVSHFSNANLERCLCVAQEYWKLNPNGTFVLDWYDIIKDLNWELSLA